MNGGRAIKKQDQLKSTSIEIMSIYSLIEDLCPENFINYTPKLYSSSLSGASIVIEEILMDLEKEYKNIRIKFIEKIEENTPENQKNFFIKDDRFKQGYIWI